MHDARMAKDAAVTVRLPAALKQQLRLRAQRERRSLSAEIARVLERSVAAEPAGGPGRLLGLYEGMAVPTGAHFAEVRALLWGRLGRRGKRS